MLIKKWLLSSHRIAIMAVMSSLLILSAGQPRTSAAAAVITPSFTQVETNTYYSVALRSDGSVWTWGRNLYGELGIEKKVTIGRFPTPLRLSNLSKIIGISVDVSNQYQLGVQSDGTIWEWGRDVNVYKQSILPRTVKGITGAVAAASGGGIASALLNDGTIVSWGRLAGDDDSQVKATPIAKLQNVTAIKQDGQFGYAVTKDGFVYAWVSKLDVNRNLVLGKPYKLPGIANIKQSNANWDATIDKSGRLCSWQLDPYTTTPSSGLTFVEKPACVALPLKVKQASGNLLLADTGVVYMMKNGKPVKVNGLPAIVSITSSSYHQLAIDKQGQIWGWGANQWFETGSPTSSSDGMVYKPALLERGVDIFINGQLITSSVPAYVSQSSVQIPINSFSKRLGIQFTVATGIGEKYSTIYKLVRGDKTLTITREADRTLVELNGQPIPFPEGIGNSVGSVTVPYEMLSALGITASWDETMHRLKLTV
ncbi:RCC1 domain-containing protein [Paenibacillus sp. MMS18-CY102]|uniref:RCC1 domain-containing protein n=1 Tax=Paenibacillus sp. MMS18-CY102 TaxID=2682849 RepID=UPI0013655122|nr:hypothetical protein [Paenibacillus sp. MMS18-CY102]MWC28067.1 hypothetical protein [Paenibacillus sp. MMS18-CY102]